MRSHTLPRVNRLIECNLVIWST